MVSRHFRIVVGYLFDWDPGKRIGRLICAEDQPIKKCGFSDRFALPILRQAPQDAVKRSADPQHGRDTTITEVERYL